MDEISGSTDSLISLGMAMSDARLKNALAIQTLKKGLDGQARNAMSLIEAVPPPSASVNTSSTGRLLDVVA